MLHAAEAEIMERTLLGAVTTDEIYQSYPSSTLNISYASVTQMSIKALEDELSLINLAIAVLGDDEFNPTADIYRNRKRIIENEIFERKVLLNS